MAILKNALGSARAAAVLIGVAAAGADAQQGGVLHGRVTDAESGLPLAEALVEDRAASLVALTDSAGAYELRGVPAGERRVHVSRIGYADAERRVALPAGARAVLDVALRPAAVGLDPVTAIGEARSAAAMREVRQSPYAVAVVDGQRLAERGLTLDDAIQRVSGVQVRRSGGLGSASIFHVRGLEGRRVQVYIDGNSVNILGDSFSLDDIPLVLVERVEVYKGIVPARFGGDGLGAAVNVVMRDLAGGYDDFGYTAGTYGQHQFAGVMVRPIGRALRAGIAVNVDRAANDYIMESPYVPGLEIRRDHDRFRRELVGIVAQYERGWFDELRLEGAVLRSRREVQGIQTNVQHAESGTFTGALVLEGDREGALGGRLDMHGALVATSSNSTLVDTSSVRYSFAGEPFPSPNGRGELGLLPAHSDNRLYTLRHRNALIYRASPAHTLNVTYTLDHSRHEPSDTLANRYAGRNVSEYPGRQTSAVIGLSHEWRPGDGALMNVFGARGYLLRSEGTPSNIFNPSGERPPSVRNRTTSFGASHAVRYFVTPELLAKGSIELARRLPSSTELFGDGLLVLASPALRPEQSRNVNLGVQYERHAEPARRIQAEATVFRMDMRDMIRLAPGGFAGIATHSNLGRARITGVDVEAKADLTRWLHASAGLTYQNARDVQRLSPGTQVPNPTYGLRLPNMPWLFGSTLVELSRADLFGTLQRSRLFHELSFTGEYFYAFEMSRHQERRIPGAVTHNVGVEHKWFRAGLSVSAEVQNATNARVLNQFNHPLPGRTFRVKLRYTRVLDDRPPGIEIQSGGRE